MKHALIEDDEPVRFHFAPNRAALSIPIVDVGILFYGKFWVEEDLVDEFRIAVYLLTTCRKTLTVVRVFRV